MITFYVAKNHFFTNLFFFLFLEMASGTWTLFAFASWRHFNKECHSLFLFLITVTIKRSPPPVEFDCGLPRTPRESLEETDKLFLAQLPANLSRLRHLN